MARETGINWSCFIYILAPGLGCLQGWVLLGLLLGTPACALSLQLRVLYRIVSQHSQAFHGLQVKHGMVSSSLRSHSMASSVVCWSSHKASQTQKQEEHRCHTWGVSVILRPCFKTTTTTTLFSSSFCCSIICSYGNQGNHVLYLCQFKNKHILI